MGRQVHGKAVSTFQAPSKLVSPEVNGPDSVTPRSGLEERLLLKLHPLVKIFRPELVTSGTQTGLPTLQRDQVR